MKKIGEGYYYNVYDLGNGRVLKKQKTKLRIFLFICVFNNIKFFNTVKQYNTVIQLIKIMPLLYKKVISTGIDINLLGNPLFLGGIDYEQDKVRMIEKEINSMSMIDFEKTIIDYTDLIKNMWASSFNEVVYNFTRNSGYTAENKFILIDFNEISFDIEHTKISITKKDWLKKHSYQILKSDRKKLYKTIMEAEITEVSILENWKK